MKVLVTLDGSELALTIMPAVRRILEMAADTEVHLLTVLDPRRAQGSPERAYADPATSPMTNTGPVVAPPLPRVIESHGEALSRLHLEAADELQAVSQTHLSGTTPLTHVVWSAKPAEAICEQARELGVDFIAMATHGRSGLSHLLAGSVTEGVIRHAGLPVLVVGPDRSA